LKDQKFNLLGQNLFLHPYKSLFWEENKILFLSDLHIGKAAHFRKSGIPVPEAVHQHDFDHLIYLIKFYKPDRLIFLGDLFHSSYNPAWDRFRHLFSSQITVKPELVSGNHDILASEDYNFMDVYLDSLIIEPFILSHVPLEENKTFGFYNLCGHLHPSIQIYGRAKQSFRVDCFYFGKNHGILPAFGNFTGRSRIPAKKPEDRIFAIAENEIIPLK
jgi:DNA ligase-associated metallophosphoesterase